MIYVSIIFLVLSALISVGNIGGVTAALIRKKKGIDRGYSCIPFFSILFSLGAWLLGRNTIGLWAFTPALLDPGTWMIVAFPKVLFEAFRDKKEKRTEP